MRKALLILLSGIFCALTQPMSAQIIAPESLVSDTLISIADTLVSDSMPEWYVAPEIPLFLRAPKRAAAAACNKVAAIQTYDINSQLVEATYYEYDNAGRVISTTIWIHNADGSQTGKSKLEYSFDAYGNQVSTVVYDWDNTMNIWHGVSRYEYVYDAEQRMISNTEYAWVNYAWAADIKYTWAYDAEGREAEYFSYKRNTTTNQLDPVNGFIYTWLSDTQKSLEIIYTTYSNGAWNGGTKKEWVFDAEGRQTSYAYYSTITNGNWIGNTKETWTYGGPTGQLTLYEKFGWVNNNWSKTVKEETKYEGNNITRIENYTYANGVTTGTRKEEYTYENNKPKQTIIYAWSNGMWIGSSNETWLYGGPSGQLTLHEKYEWLNNNWSITLKEETQYSGANIVRIENYTYANGVPTGTKKELTTYSGGKKTEILTFAWENGDWVNSNKETWEFNGPSGKQTKHEKCEWDGSDWAVMVQENTIYNGNTTTVINYERLAGVWTGTKKEENTVEGGKPSQTIIYAWDANAQDWVDFSKETWGYTAGKTTSYEKYLWENGAYVKSAREVWAYSGSQQTLYEKYEGQNDAWVGLEKEVWGYTSGRQTLYETYEWYNNNWSITLREKSGYDAAGNKNSIENYAGSEGVLTGTQKEEYTFNSAKEVIETIKYKWSENTWVKDTKNVAGYIEGDTEYYDVNYSWNGNAWIGTGTKTIITYNAAGDKYLVYAYTWDNEIGDWGYNARRVYAYDSKGREVGDTTYHYINSQWENYKLQTHGYDSHDNDTLAITATWNGTEWEATYISKGTYTYTAAGNPLLIETYTGTEGKWIGGQKVEYSYVTINNEEILTLYWQYQWKNGQWVNKSRTTQTYDEAGHILLNVGENWSANKWVGSYKFENEFDANGNQTMQAQYSWSGSTWRGTSRTDRGYTANGDIAYTISYTWRNNNWVYRSKTEYIRDNEGRVLDKKVYSYSSNTWVNSQWNTYAYDSKGQEISSWEYYWIYEQWLPAYCNEKTYDESDNKLLREKLGTWNVDVIQSYTDNYYFYNCDPHFYTVGFMNYDGKGLAYNTQKEGQMPVYNGAAPTKPSTVEYAYSFAGWTPSIVPVTSEATYIATYTETKNKYTITWLNEDGSTIIDQTNVAYGEVPTHADASKENTAQYTYTFTGWSPTITSVTGDASYTAQFNSTVNKYTITFKNGNEVLQSTEVAFGEKPVYGGSIPTKDPDDQYHYAFAGWDKEIVEVAGEETYTATFTPTTNEYTISWFNDDNTLIDQTTVAYGVVPTHEDPTKENTAEWTYTFSGWDHEPVAVTGAASYTAVFTATKNSYTITWLNEDGDEIEHETLEYGKTPEHTAPAKENTAEWTYTFTGWTPAIVDVVSDASYKAVFNATKNSYIIKFVNYNGEVLQSTNVEYGVKPEYKGSVPVKPEDDEYHYAFAGWDKEIVEVGGEETYTATFSTTTNEYTISWFSDDNTLIDQTTVAYGVVPTHEDPTKENTAEWTYTFSGWDHEPVAVTGNSSYKATYTAQKNSYTITWLNEDGSEIESETLEFGVTPEHVAPTKDNTIEWTYTFTGWEPAIVDVTGNAEYTATFSATKNKYTITFLNYDGTELQSGEVEYGVKPTYEGADPTKPADAQDTYTFIGWDKDIVEVDGDATYTATYRSDVNSYTITWLNDDNSLLEETTVEYGKVPEHAAPTKENTAEWTYTFNGWDPTPVEVTGVATYKATFNASKNIYTITWKDEEGKEIGSDVLAYGETPKHEDLTKDNTAEWTYTFKGWTPSIIDVVGDATYTAVFDQEKNQYTIKFVNYDGSELQSTDVPYGEKPVYTGDTPTKPDDEEFHYAFAGWDKEIVKVEGEETYTATFTPTTNEYTISWFNDDNSLIDQTTVAYGVVPTHEDPTKENTAEWTYTFAGWDHEPVAVTGNASYTATYNATKNKYLVVFQDEGGAELQNGEVEYGATPEYKGAEPSKEATAQYTYAFSGWDPEITAVESAQTYTATYSSTVNKYTIRFINDDDSELQSSEVEYGTMPTYNGETPHKDADEQYTYTFAEWDQEIVSVTGEATYKATYSSTTNQYTVKFLNYDGEELQSSSWNYGATPSYTGEVPTKPADDENHYAFAGWSPIVSVVTKDATYTATYTEAVNEYTITWFNDDNTLIDQTTVAYGVVPTHDDPTKENTAEFTYTFTGWDHDPVAVTGNASYTATYTATKNSYTITWLNEDGSEIEHVTLEFGATPNHIAPTKENTAEWTYTFTGWTPAIASVEADASYQATFSATKNSYTITWLNDDGSELEHETLEYGATPSHADIYKESTAEWIYTFAGWDPEIKSVTGDASYTATFDAVEATIYYHITVTADDAAHGQAGFVYTDAESSTLLTDYNVASGTWIELRAIASDDWHFDHWSDGDIASVRQIEVTEDMQITAHFASNCGDYPTLPVVSLYDWLVMLDVRSIHAMGYTFSEEDVIWYRVKGEPDKESDGAQADDVRVGSGYSFTLNESLINSGDYYAMVDVSSSPAGTLCSDMMRSQIIHFASNRAYMPPRLTPALVRPCEPQQILHLDPEFPTTVTIYDLSGHLLRTFSEESVDRMDMQAENVTGCYQVVVQNGDQRTVLRYIVVQ